MTNLKKPCLFDSSTYDNKDSGAPPYNNEPILKLSSVDISENIIREQMPDILNLLLIDRTTSTSKHKKNIIWATQNYIQYGQKHYTATSQIKPELITGDMGQIIMPRVLKSQFIQKQRTKSKAEVFTPTWIVKKQNDAIDANYLNDDLETYIKRKWLEITCGEAPYMASRYDMETGRLINLLDRVGFIDRKLQRINAEIDNKAEWQLMVEKAYQASYGFEWSGDSLLLARENLLYTYRDYYMAKWFEEPSNSLLKQIAEIISYNIFQMDGINYIIPLSNKKEKTFKNQLVLFDNTDSEKNRITKGIRVKIMNWDTKKMAFFDKAINQNNQ
ncbi:restriction endonuclease [Neisseria montereyensis]|uniref:Restriction endonuclease n=1 Tax=Neisseria montereyensis TaxID=2973938 RepID=A0ABT2FBK2_9NEIS|nr:restriction endonuclease [Neisseria montereyensis]MCS4533542.1 restriction endonuclease [Neisseria montereyensis]